MGEPIRTRVTWAEYQLLPEDGKRYEVLEGELMMSPAPGFRHQRTSGNLYFALDSWRRAHAPGGQVLAAPFDVILSEDTILQPDLIYVRPERIGLIVDEKLRGAPDLAIEIFHSQGAGRDRISKLQVYARFKVPEYWLVDLDARAVTMLVLTPEGYEILASGFGDTMLTSRVLPGLALTPREVFEGI
jgi:Uma2 family endonuclease